MEQQTLMDRPTRAMERARALRDAELRKQRGMAQAESSAEWQLAGWCDLALRGLRDFALLQESPFLIEEARTSMAAWLPAPPDARAWGRVAVMAIKAGYIVPTGSYMPAASSNGAPKMLYRRGLAA